MRTFACENSEIWFTYTVFSHPYWIIILILKKGCTFLSNKAFTDFLKEQSGWGVSWIDPVTCWFRKLKNGFKRNRMGLISTICVKDGFRQGSWLKLIECHKHQEDKNFRLVHSEIVHQRFIALHLEKVLALQWVHEIYYIIQSARQWFTVMIKEILY